MQKIKALIFDFDWVIHDTFEFHKNKIKEFADYDIPDQLYRDLHNWNFFDAKLPEEVKNLDWFKYKEFIYEDKIKLKTDISRKDIIKKLWEKYDLFVVSSWSSQAISKYLKNNEIGSLFKWVLGMEEHKQKIEKFKHILATYDLEVSNCLFITDTLWDILEANHLWIKTCAVDFGYHDRELLSKWQPYKIVSSFEDILHLLNY